MAITTMVQEDMTATETVMIPMAITKEIIPETVMMAAVTGTEVTIMAIMIRMVRIPT